jgi:phosphoesterase RecJ-like protein
MYPEAEDILKLIQAANTIAIIQPDNPDGDSLGSSLGLEQLLFALGKQTILICGTSMPVYLHYIPGWDRVETELPAKFDLSIIVDTSSISLLENLTKHIGIAALRSKPSIVIDHHRTEASIDFTHIMLNQPDAAATAEVIYQLAKQLKLEIPLNGKNALAAAILADSLGLTADSTTAQTVHTIGELVEGGVSLSQLENARRDMIRKRPDLVHYKGQLLQRIEYYDQDRVALLTIPWAEIEQYSPIYNPSVLALDDMRLTTNTVIAVALKLYPDGKVTAKIRSNYGFPIAAKLAENFGGGGHDYASGFKIERYDQSQLKQLKTDIVNKSRELIDEIV